MTRINPYSIAASSPWAEKSVFRAHRRPRILAVTVCFHGDTATDEL